LSHASGFSDFVITLPVRLNIPGSHDYTLTPAQEADIFLCAAGDRGAMNWIWIPSSGDPFPPPGLTFAEDPVSGNASISGIPQTTSYRAQGALQVQQGNKIDSVPASLQVILDFHPSLGDACGLTNRVTPGESFSCEMPRPRNFDAYDWAVVGGELPPGLNLVQVNAVRWRVDGTVPGQMGSINSPVGTYQVNSDLLIEGSGAIASRQYSFQVGTPFSVWMQNTNLRPNNPFVPNTGDDNEERTDYFLNRIAAFDIIALQEVFDDDQRYQISTGHSADYHLLFGPSSEASPFGEDAGLALLLKGDPQIDSSLDHNEVFQECEEALKDCLSDKGFSVTKYNVGPLEHIYIVNTHLQAGYDSPEQHSAT
jgi:hypothetical protein